jgi:FG-GAP repeat
MRSPLAILVLAATSLLAPVADSAARTVSVPGAAALTLVGEQPGDLTGAAVAGAGDVNGDGRADVIVGAPLADVHGRTDAGAAYVVFGGCATGTLHLASLGACGFRIDGAVPLPAFTRHKGSNALTSGAGAVVAGPGDVNGDGLADIALSGREAGPFGSAPTVVYVVFGKRDTGELDLGALGGAGFAIRSGVDGLTVVDGHAAGDVNGDGLADVAVRTGLDGDEDAGSLQVVFGRRAPTSVAVGASGAPGTSFMVAGGFAGMQLGQGVAPAGDVNRDGFGDLLIGAPGVSSRRVSDERGAVFVLYGRATPNDARIRPRQPFDGYTVRGPRSLEGFGYAVASLGGGGLVAGAPGAVSRGLHGPGGAWILRSKGASFRHIVGPREGGPAGVAVAAPGDVTGDRRPDVLVLARGRRNRQAAAWLYSLKARREVVYKGLRNATEARIAGAAAGDVIGNARPDVILGSPGAGRAYILG